MSKEKSNTDMPVTSIGNSWAVFRSKSHPGHVYYFNTSTGKAVWNLSESEINKEKESTLERQTDVEPITHQEPKDNPPTFKKIKKPSENKNDFYQTPWCRDMFQQHSQGNIVQSQGVSAPIYSDITMNSMPTFDMNNPINTINLISSPTVYNANGWAISRTPQIVFTPSIPVLNQGQSSLNVAYNNLIRTSQPHALRSNHYQNRCNRIYTKNRYDRGGRRNFQTLHQNDLRQQLYLKRRLGNIANQETESFDSKNAEDESTSSMYKTSTKTADVSSHIIDEEFYNNDQDHVVDENHTNAQIEGEPPNLDLNPLKCLAPSNSKPDIWYIVVDLNVLLEEFNFLNAMTNSDKNCYLLVPEYVMTELKDYIACSNNIPARRIYHSLSQQVESGCAFIAKEPSQDYGDAITNPIIKTCLELFEDDYHVVLLTNDNKVLSYKKFMKISIFSVDEVRTLLENNQHQPLFVSQPAIRTIKSPPHSSKIKAPRTTHVVETIVKDSLDKDILKENIQTKEITSLKHTVDAAIQTETVTIVSNENTDTFIDKGESHKIVKSSNNTTQKPNNAKTLSPPSKRREIKLKRSISNQPQPPSISKNIEKKPFRWRRKRNHNQINESTTNNDTISESKIASVQTDTVNSEHEKQVDEVPYNNHEAAHNTNSSEIVESRDSSIVSMNNKLDNFTIIEETSTSGMISNTDSNCDGEIYYKNFEDKVNEGLCDEKNTNIVMFEIDSENMAESLKTKCEEWVSRFIQIMEEVLTVVLNKEPAFLNIEFPPPWTMHEAAQCIRKYCDDPTVKIITDKFSILLFRLGDDKGHITWNMTPCQYMEMYSYGVSLLNALKAITTSYEDIKIAEESLQKLLVDIKNPNYGLNDPLIESHEESHTQVSHNVNEDNDLESPKKVLRLNESVNYNLRSKVQRLMKKADEPPAIRNNTVKNNFLSSLYLQEVSPNSSFTETNVSYGTQNQTNDRTPHGSLSGELNKLDNKTIHSPTIAVTPNIVRNFTIFAEYEAKLKEPLNTDANDKYLDYDEDEYASDADTELSDPNITQELEISDYEIIENPVTSSPIPVEPTAPSNSNTTFKFIICMFLQEVKKALHEVKVLCDKCYTELKNPQLPVLERNELRKRVENSQVHIVGLSMSLESMLAQNPDAPTANMLTALKKAGIDWSQIDKRLILDYWNTIAKWKKYADVFLDSVRDIISALKI